MCVKHISHMPYNFHILSSLTFDCKQDGEYMTFLFIYYPFIFDFVITYYSKT